MKTFLGIISPRGLEYLCEETEHASRFLSMRCYKSKAGDKLLCWAALQREDAEIIHQIVRGGGFAEALRRFHADAHYLGSLPPTQLEDCLA
ncbi:MAG: hypothetical protein KDA61_02000 [Planctomycetales bacterium]|nr:hypothetical protein [Planctomycetales bacterium]